MILFIWGCSALLHLESQNSGFEVDADPNLSVLVDNIKLSFTEHLHKSAPAEALEPSFPMLRFPEGSGNRSTSKMTNLNRIHIAVDAAWKDHCCCIAGISSDQNGLVISWF